MKYFSEVLNEKFDTEDALVEAETAYEAKVAAEKERKENLSKERKARATEIEDLVKQRMELDETINEKIDAFTNDYGYFHCTVKNSTEFPFTRPWFDTFFDHWFNFRF